MYMCTYQHRDRHEVIRALAATTAAARRHEVALVWFSNTLGAVVAARKQGQRVSAEKQGCTLHHHKHGTQHTTLSGVPIGALGLGAAVNAAVVTFWTQTPHGTASRAIAASTAVAQLVGSHAEVSRRALALLRLTCVPQTSVTPTTNGHTITQPTAQSPQLHTHPQGSMVHSRYSCLWCTGRSCCTG